jgi:DNA primase
VDRLPDRSHALHQILRVRQGMDLYRVSYFLPLKLTSRSPLSTTDYDAFRTSAAHLPNGLSLGKDCVSDLDPPHEPLVQFGVESQPFAMEPDLFLALEEVLALLLDQNPAASARPRRLMSLPSGSSLGSKPTPGGRSAYQAFGTVVHPPRIFVPGRVTLSPMNTKRGENICTPVQGRPGLRISQQSIEEVRETAGIVEVASEFTALRRQGARFTGLCPYPDHQEKTPSFSITPDRGLYYCYGCLRGGDAIKLVMDLKSLDFAEAVSYLADRSGVDLQFEGGGDQDAARERSLRRRAIHRALAAATVYYHKYLLTSNSPEVQRARSYLEDRQIKHSTIEEFRLGYAPPRGVSGFVAVAGRFDLDRSVLDAAGLISPRGGERFAGRITFPISDRRGRIVGFGARTLGDAQPKYLNSPETEIFNKRDLLYGFPQVSEAIRRERSALVVEGYTDVLMLYQSGIENAVATLGTATTPGHLRMLSRYADRIHVLFDPDAAGERAIERAAATAADLKLDLRVLRLPEDPADWLLEHSPREFSQKLNDSVPVLEYGIRRIVARTRGADATERSRAVPEVRSLIQEINDPVLYREALRLATESLGVSPDVLQAPQQPTTPASSSRTPADPQTEAGGAVLMLILARPDLTATLLQEGIEIPQFAEPLKLQGEDFPDETLAKIFALLRDNAGRDLDAVLSDQRARPLMDQIGALATQGERLYPSQTSVREAWLRLAILSREQSKRETLDYDVKDALQSEIQHLKLALRSSATGA